MLSTTARSYHCQHAQYSLSHLLHVSIQNAETEYLNAHTVVVESASDTAADEDEDKDSPRNKEIVLEAKSGGVQTKSVVVAQLLLMLTIGMHHLRVVFF